MLTGWIEKIQGLVERTKKQFVSADARYEVNKDARSYEMLSRESSAMASVPSPITPRQYPLAGRGTPNFFRDKPSPQGYESTALPQSPLSPQEASHANDGRQAINPLGMNRIG